MGFYRIYSSKDVWITDKTLSTATNTASGSNHGRDPSLSIFAKTPLLLSGTKDLARSLLQFNMTELSGKIFDEKTIPSSSVTYILRMHEAIHSEEVPSSYDLVVYPLSRSWDEGNGIDDVDFLDSGYANWVNATSTTAWSTTGSDFITNNFSASQHFDQGDGDLEVDVTAFVNEWLTGTLPNYGLVVKLGDTEETNAIDYFVKKFHARETKFVDKIPYIEARWGDVVKDNRKNFGFNVSNKLFAYNFVRGELTNVQEPVTVRVESSGSFVQTYSAVQLEPGILSASIVIENTASFSSSIFNDIWFSGSTVLMTGTFIPLVLTGSQIDPYDEFDLEVTNLKREYRTDEEARLNVTVRKRDFKTHLGVVSSASLEVEREYVEKMYYSVINDESGETVVPFGTGSVPYTQLSYNGDGNYFNLWFGGFIPGFKYRLLFLIDINKHDKKVVDEDITFTVV